MSEPAPNETPRGSDALWRVVIIAIFVVGGVVAIGFPLINGNVRSALLGVAIIAFGILIAAIRSVRR